MSLRDKIERGQAALRGGIVAVSAPDLFPTPPEVAARVAAALGLFPSCRVMEPSAGTGALVRAIRNAEPSARITAYEISHDLAHVHGGIAADFLTIDPPQAGPQIDRVAMNPPFSGGADIQHVRHALRFLVPGGVLVAIVADGPRQAVAFADAEDLERLPSGTFAGTGVRSRIIRYTKGTGDDS